MAKIIVFNNDTNQMEVFYRNEEDPMPYTQDSYLLVGEFRGSSQSPTLWTSKQVMQSFDQQREIWGGPINVGYAFKRPWEGGHSNQSQHYAGTAFDTAQGWTNEERAGLRASAINSGLWTYVEPVSIAPTWVHFDRRDLPPACPSGGYPVLRQGSRGNYVLILQDSLNTLGFTDSDLDGIFGPRTREAVTAYQRSKGLTADGVVGCGTWTALQEDVVGKGRTATTRD